MKCYYKVNWSGDHYRLYKTPRGYRLDLLSTNKDNISSASWIIKYGELAVNYSYPARMVNPNTSYGDLMIRDILAHGHLVKGSINRTVKSLTTKEKWHEYVSRLV